MGRKRTGTEYVNLNGGREHQLVLGVRYGDLPGFVVHHKDGNKRNNTSENLELMLRGDHTSLHHITAVCSKGHIRTPENTYVRPDGRGRQCIVCRTEQAKARPSREVYKLLGKKR